MAWQQRILTVPEIVGEIVELGRPRDGIHLQVQRKVAVVAPVEVWARGVKWAVPAHTTVVYAYPSTRGTAARTAAWELTMAWDLAWVLVQVGEPKRPIPEPVAQELVGIIARFETRAVCKVEQTHGREISGQVLVAHDFELRARP